MLNLYTPCYRFQAQRTSSNLHEPHHHRDSKVCRGLSHEFGVVRLYQTFSMYLVTGETRSAGCLCTRSGWFKHIEPHRTYTNHIITETNGTGCRKWYQRLYHSRYQRRYRMWYRLRYHSWYWLRYHMVPAAEPSMVPAVGT